MTEVLFVYENDIPFLYTKSENGSVQKKRIALVDANPENLRQKRIRKIQTNYPEHLDYLEKYIGSNSPSKTFQNNFLLELSNPLDNSNFLKNLIQDIHLNRGLSDIRSLSLTRPRFIPLNPINIHDLQYIEAKIMAYFINNNSSIILRKLGDNRETENLIKTLSETENISKFIPYFEMSTNGYQNFIHEQEIKVNEETFNVLKSIFDKQANLHNTTLGEVNEDEKVEIYLNIKNQKILYNILEKYIYLCIYFGIDYNLEIKTLNKDYEGKDKVILYSDYNTLLTRIQILERIAYDNPKMLFDDLEEPPLGTAKIGTGYYGIGSTYNNLSYLDNFDILSEIAYLRVLASLFLKNRFNFKNDISKPIRELINLDKFYCLNNKVLFANQSLESIREYLLEELDKYPSLKTQITEELKEMETISFFRNTIIKIFNLANIYSLDKDSNVAVTKEMKIFFSNLPPKFLEREHKSSSEEVKKETERINVKLENFLRSPEIPRYLRYLESYNNHAKENNDVMLEVNEKGEVILPIDTLLHGISMWEIDENILFGIRKFGIVASELLNREYNSPTLGCADFFHLKYPMTLKEYEEYYQENVDYRKLVKTNGGPNPILNNYIPTSKNKNLMFILLGNNSSEIISNNALTDDKPFNQRVKERMNEIPVQARYAYSMGEALAIPVGVPSNYIVGIILGGQYTEEELKNIRKIFPDTAIISYEGKVLYEGKRIGKTSINAMK